MAKKLWVENGQAIPAVVYAENPTNLDFTDYETSIEKWSEYGLQVKDFNFVRNKILTLVVSIVQPNYSLWNNLTLDQKKIACKFVVAPYALRVPTIFTDEEDKEHWRKVLELTQGQPISVMQGRARIFQEMRIYVGEYLRTDQITLANTQDFYKSVYNLANWFVNSNSPDFKWWINNEVGTPYENDGFAQKSYYSQAIKDGLNTIYSGDY